MLRVAKLSPGLYEGYVQGTMLPNNTVEVDLIVNEQRVLCVWCAGFISGLHGFKLHFIPPDKTKVVVFYTGGKVSYIVGCLPEDYVDKTVKRSITDPTGSHNYQASQIFASRNHARAETFASHKIPMDLTEGEVNIENLLGVGLSMLRHFCSLQAGDLARIECHLLDDMVRIISRNYKQHSAFGDLSIVNDGGKLNVEWHGTSHDHEAEGLISSREDKARLTKDDPDKVDFSTIDGFTDDGRWRFSQYIGWLGDFIHLFVTDPVASVGRIAEDQLRSGRFRAHVSNDGALLVQSVTEIALEKVVRIPVPVRKRRSDDPQGNQTNDTDRRKDRLKTWNPSGNLFEMAFQLRQYARWLNNEAAFARFRQMDLDFQVPSEKETPEPSPFCAETDRQQINGSLTNVRYAYACYRIYRDGSIQQIDAYGNSITTTEVGMQIATPKDLLLQAGGSVNIVAGRDINLLARKNIGITAVTEKLRLKAQTGLQLFAEAGNILLETLVSKVVKVMSTLNVNNAVELSYTGTVTAINEVKAMRVSAAITMMADDHMGHIFPGVAVITNQATENFEFQSSYGGGPLYETVTQQMMRLGDIAGGSEWSFSDNLSAGRGSPWPGSVQHKQFSGGEALNGLSESHNFSASPGSMAQAPITMKVQS